MNRAIRMLPTAVPCGDVAERAACRGGSLEQRLAFQPSSPPVLSPPTVPIAVRLRSSLEEGARVGHRGTVPSAEVSDASCHGGENRKHDQTRDHGESQRTDRVLSVAHVRYGEALFDAVVLAAERAVRCEREVVRRDPQPEAATPVRQRAFDTRVRTSDSACLAA